MIRTSLIPWLFTLAGLAAADSPDLLRFSNGDQLHGTFLGLKEGPQAVWRSDDLAAPVEFKTTRVRHVVLHGGRPLKPLGSLSHLGLVNGDRVPGTITGIDGDHVTLDTSYAGVLRIPRKQVSMIAPNPLGGRVYYYGPFVENEWKMAHAAYPEGWPADDQAKDTKTPDDQAKDAKTPDDQAADPKAQDDQAADAKVKAAKEKDAKAPEAKVKDAKVKEARAQEAGVRGARVRAIKARNDEGQEAGEPPGRWFFSGSAWYWKHKRAGTALIRETGMPDRAVLRFDLAWKNRLCIAIAFHADFARPKAKEGEENEANRVRRGFVPGDAADLPRLFGNSYVLQMYSNYMMLYRTSVSEDGKPSLEQVQLNNNNLRLMETGEAQVEVRSNRHTGAISLFINDEFIAQWSENEAAGQDGAGYAGKGGGFGFVVQGDDTPVRISDIVVSEWNGMPDSARSLQVDDQDVVLMANGTDRYAGRVGSLDAHGKVLFEGKHGQFQFPLNEVAEIRFARERLAAVPDEPADNLVVRFYPIGAVSGHPVSGDGSTLGILSTSAGEMNLSLESAVMLDFNCSKQIIDDWDAEF